MSHFQRVGYQIAPHYLHSYPSAPRGVHPVMPLMPLMPYTYGSADYGIALDQIVGHYAPEWAGGRKSIETLRKQNSNTAVYAAYDNIRDLDAAVPREWARRYAPGMSDVTMISTWSDMAGTVAASDSGAVLKTSYLLLLAALITNDLDLNLYAKAAAEDGVKKGEAAGSAKKTANITSIYTNALEKLQASKGYRSKGSGSPQVQTILAALQAGTGQKAVDARVKTYRKDQEDLKNELPQNEGGNRPNPPCDDTWKSYIPGLCTAEQTGDTISWGVKVTAGLLTVAVVAWGASKVIKSTRSARSNPSAPGRTDTGPEEEIASMPKAREQETRMNKHVFKRNA